MIFRLEFYINQHTSYTFNGFLRLEEDGYIALVLEKNIVAKGDTIKEAMKALSQNITREMEANNFDSIEEPSKEVIQEFQQLYDAQINKKVQYALLSGF